MMYTQVKKYCLRLLGFGVWTLCVNSYPEARAQAHTPVQIKSIVPAIPVLRGLQANPIICLRVYVPANGTSVQFQKMLGSLNADAVAAIDSLYVFSTGSEPLFSLATRIAAVAPKPGPLSIPITFSAKPGLQYLWISARLKSQANIKQMVSVKVHSLVDGAGKSYAVQGNSAAPHRVGVAVRKAWDDSVHSYRIPGLTTTDKGTLLAVYDIRYKHSGDLPANIDVGLSRSVDGGNTWEPMRVIMDMGAPHENNGVGDPTILFDPATRKIWVAALWSKGNRSIAGSKPGLSPDETGQLVLVSSNDDGRTWSAPESITPQVKNPAWNLYFNGPGNGIAMQNGTLVFPAQYWDEKGMPHSAIIYSEDHGLSWKSGVGAKSNTTESQVAETHAGTLMLNMRDNRGGFRSVATTTDLGKHWVEHPTSYSDLPDPVCMASLLKARVLVKGQQKDILFFSNVNDADARKNMTIKASTNLGESWPATHQLLIDERKSFGYSALTRIDENTLGLLYEGSRDLYFVRIPISEILK